MVLRVKHRYAHYRRYLLDIWGVVRIGIIDLEKGSNEVQRSFPESSTLWWSRHRIADFLDQGSRRRTRLLLFFFRLWEKRRRRRYQRARKYIYRMHSRGPQRWKRYHKPTFLPVRLVRLFYLSYNYRQLKRLIWGAHGRSGFYEENLALALEGRLLCFLYRTGFVSSLFSSMELIASQAVLINNSPVDFIHRRVIPGDLVSFAHLGPAIVYERLLKRLQKKAAFFPHAPFLFVSFRLLCAYYKRSPRMRELIFPIRLDLHAVINYFAGRR